MKNANTFRIYLTLSIASTFFNATMFTVLSVFSQSDSFGQLTGGPLLGWVGTIFSLRVAMVVATLALVPAVGLFAKVSRQFRTAFYNA